uniref:Uncharacterized protein n=1 Tax=Haptolina brevifila TaxID=156173 RepID=A0A7S2IC98_9EUKA
MDDLFALGLPHVIPTLPPADVPSSLPPANVHDSDNGNDLFRQVLTQAANAPFFGGGTDALHPIDAARLKTKTLAEIKKQKLAKKAMRNTVVKPTGQGTQAQMKAAAQLRRKTPGGSLETTLRSKR